MTLQTQKSLLEMKNIVISFEGNTILHNVDFTAHGGEIHALLGANGAGKSTLVKVLSGAYQPDSASIVINGEKVVIPSPKAAKENGIHCIYQEVDTALFPDLTVAENIMIEQRTGSWIRWKAVHRQAKEILSSIGIDLATDRVIHQLSLAEKQLVLIARAFATKASVLIFDEPTAPLSLSEAEKLFAIARILKSKGVICIFISHRLQEVFELCDRITVMRDGKRISTKATKDTSIDEVIETMIGTPIEEEFPRNHVSPGERVLTVENVSGGKIRNVSFSVHQGEIVGIVGLVGAGKTELSRLLFGIDATENGTIKMNGEDITINSPKQAKVAGIALVPEERRKEGILVEESVKVNLSLPSLINVQFAGLIQHRKEQQLAAPLIQSLNIKAAWPDQQTRFLSGGNQQKVSIGKWLPTQAQIFLLDEPTKGVDIGAKREIYKLLDDLAQQGKSIIYFSCEMAEIMGISDRILVIYDGQIVKEFKRHEATQEKILFYASGGKEAKGNE